MGAALRTELKSFVADALWTRVISIADEAASTLVRTSFSTSVRINHDFACGVFDKYGSMLAQSTDSGPTQLGGMPSLVKDVCKMFPADTLSPGDVLATNDPWIGCGHSPDMYLVEPVFHRDRLVGFVANSAHLIDIGGRIASQESTEVYEEGIIIPVKKLYIAGEPNTDIFDIIERNVRFPDQVIGDMRAQMAANFVAKRRMLELLEEYRLDGLDVLAEYIIGKTERAFRDSIRAIPDGVYKYESEIEEFDRQGNKLKICVAVHVRGDELVADYTGTSPQVDRPINCVRNVTDAHTVLGAKLVLNAGLPNNEGSYRPVKVIVPEGTILNATHPAPVFWRVQVGHLLSEYIFMALASVQPEGVVAQSGSMPSWFNIMSGKREDGSRFVLWCHCHGGLGARYTRDGISCVRFPGNIPDVPSEVVELEAPLLIEKRELRCDSGGAGRTRGGLGQTIVIRNLEAVDASRRGPIKVSITSGRLDNPAGGLAGGRPGGVGSVTRNDEAAQTECRSELTLDAGDRLTLRLPGGGGYGDPRQRPHDLVRRDVQEGLISQDAAREIYGLPDAAGQPKTKVHSGAGA